MSRRLPIGLALLVVLALAAGSAQAESGDTLRLIRARGVLRCGVSEGITGLAATAPIGQALGLAANWAALAVGSVGNYGEMFDRDLGSASPLKLDRGVNRPWTAGGLLYAPPFR